VFKSIRIGRSGRGLNVIAVAAGEADLPRGLTGVAAGSRTAARRALGLPGFEGGAGEIVFADDRTLLLGVGGRDQLNAEQVRNIGARLVRAIDGAAPRAITLHLMPALKGAGLSAATVGTAFGEGLGLANWRVDFFDGSAAATPKPRAALTVATGDAALQKGLKRGLALAESANYARRLAATPPNICHPGWIATEARKLARSVGLRCRVVTYQQAQKLGMGGLVNVGKASAHKPCLIVLEHRPAKVSVAARGQKIVLVGKTITYDTGGYSLKISNGMKGMKYDKNGGMAVIGAMHAVASLKLPVHVVGVLPAAENMVGGDAYRPDDIITMFNGVSVEVTNTDAEGRLVLADAMAWACKTLKPTAMIDAATLTGGVVVALGSWCSGLWCNDPALQRRIELAADETGEKVWPMPLWPAHREFMRSRHADLWNSGPKRDGHPIQGAAFLSYFVDDDVPWAHLDIAGVSSVDGDTDLHVTGPTGYGVRLLTEVVEGYTKVRKK
jgi:leucyl aminopeptidase